MPFTPSRAKTPAQVPSRNCCNWRGWSCAVIWACCSACLRWASRSEAWDAAIAAANSPTVRSPACFSSAASIRSTFAPSDSTEACKPRNAASCCWSTRAIHSPACPLVGTPPKRGAKGSAMRSSKSGETGGTLGVSGACGGGAAPETRAAAGGGEGAASSGASELVTGTAEAKEARPWSCWLLPAGAPPSFSVRSSVRSSVR
mmetsp:Transcript_45019/g.101636  ORF Transcript_45019/g.101636 Transcript_45019/m.101636 type:complete len:202 (+) Transcript_45019:290-895(+)